MTKSNRSKIDFYFFSNSNQTRRRRRKKRHWRIKKMSLKTNYNFTTSNHVIRIIIIFYIQYAETMNYYCYWREKKVFFALNFPELNFFYNFCFVSSVVKWNVKRKSYSMKEFNEFFFLQHSISKFFLWEIFFLQKKV